MSEAEEINVDIVTLLATISSRFALRRLLMKKESRLNFEQKEFVARNADISVILKDTIGPRSLPSRITAVAVTTTTRTEEVMEVMVAEVAMAVMVLEKDQAETAEVVMEAVVVMVKAVITVKVETLAAKVTAGRRRGIHKRPRL